MASRPPEAPWLRPPLRSLDWVETFLAGLIDEGFTDTAEVAVHEHPTVQRLRQELSQDHAAAEFEEALEELLQRMTLLRTEHQES